MEYSRVVDLDGNKIRSELRGSKLHDDEYYHIVHVWIYSKNSILIQKRGADRVWCPNYWATQTGLVLSDEDSKTAAIREVYEEVGISINENDLELIGTLTAKDGFRGYCDIYIASYDHQEVKIDNDEVVDYKFVGLNKIYQLLKENKFVSYGNSSKYDKNYWLLLENALRNRGYYE